MRQSVDLELMFGADMAECAALEFRQDPHRQADIVLPRTPVGERFQHERPIELPRVENDVLLGWEVPKEGPSSDARRGRDLVDRDIPEGPLTKQGHGGIDDRLPWRDLLLVTERAHTTQCTKCGT